MATFNQRGHSALWGAKLENGHFHPTRSFCTLRDKHWEWPLSSNKVNLHSEKQEWRMATFIQQGMDIYLFCYDVGFIATAPSFIAMSQGNHMDLITFLSSSEWSLSNPDTFVWAENFWLNYRGSCNNHYLLRVVPKKNCQIGHFMEAYHLWRITLGLLVWVLYTCRWWMLASSGAEQYWL